METEIERAFRGENKNVVIFSPHPDDAAIGVGGTMKRLIDAGSQVKVVVVTTGERGSPEAMKDESVREKLAIERASEERECAEFLGYETVQLGFHEAVGSFQGALAEYAEGADIVLVTHPEETHHTHRAVAEAVLSLPLSSELWGYEVWTPLSSPDLSVDISGVIEEKILAIRKHRSQLIQKRFDDGARGLARYRGVFCHHVEKGFEYAECLKLLNQA